MLRLTGVAGVALAFGTISHAQQTSPPVPRLITVEDVVQQAIVGDPGTMTWNDADPRIAAWSPDGSWVAVVVRRGHVARGTNDAQLLLYRASELQGHPMARVLTQFSSASKYQPLGMVRWLADGKALLCAGAEGSDYPQVFRVDVGTAKRTQLTHEQAPLDWYDISSSGTALVTASHALPVRPADTPQCLQQGCLVTAKSLPDAQDGESGFSEQHTFYDLRTGTSRVLAPPEASDTNLVGCKDDLKGGLSPDGRFGLQICRIAPHRWPDWWADYSAYPGLRELLARGLNGYLRQWVLVDFQRGSSTRLSDAPYLYGTVDRAPPQWIDGGRHFILPAAFETLADVNGSERALRAARYAVLVVDPLNLKSERAALLDSSVQEVTAAHWDADTAVLSIETSQGAKERQVSTLRRTDAGWSLATARAGEMTPTLSSPHHSLDLVMTESPNERPILKVIDAASGKSALVLDPNPWLAQRRLGRVEAVSWRSKSGAVWQGGLYYPPDFAPHLRYPLVLQTHGFTPRRFSLSGAARNFVAQPLAAAGIMVLQVAENLQGVAGTEEWPTVQDGYESAVDYLDSRKFIDRQHVGIIGWSRSGTYVGYTLTHSSYPFAAGAFTDTGDLGWWWYLETGAAHVDSEYGAAPFGAGMAVWLRMAPSFNLDRIHTPMFMWEAGQVAGLWDWYAGLRSLGKPVEYWYLPDGTHDVLKVGERLRTNQLLVDWFRFWLKDEHDPDPAKAAQYVRWTQLRKQQRNAGVTAP